MTKHQLYFNYVKIITKGTMGLKLGRSEQKPEKLKFGVGYQNNFEFAW
jgi:hypothetical protein